MPDADGFPRLGADEAAALIPHGATVGFSGFTPAGAAKAVPIALAHRAREWRKQGKHFQIRVLSGASTGPWLDETLAQADAVAWRAPYQASATLRKHLNAQQAQFADLHLSHVPQLVEDGILGDVDFAVVEAVDLTADGKVYLSTSIGTAPVYLRRAGKVIIELNRHHSPRLSEMHDVVVLPKPPHRVPKGIDHPLSKVGQPYAQVDPAKIVGVVENDMPDGVLAFEPPDPTSERIADHVVRFLADEMRSGRLGDEFLPLQSGVGNIGNAVLAGLGRSEQIPPFLMYGEVFQDAAVELMAAGRLLGASACSLTVSDSALQRIYAGMDFFAPRIVLRPQDISNSPSVIRRLGVISINTVLEMDIYGCANSTHVCGTQVMNGVGGSGDFVRNAHLSILVAPSIAKGGKVSTVVPMVTHVDHNEHSVQVLVTEQGLADLRGLAPMQRARRIIDQCAHPTYREYLHHYLDKAPMGHIRHDLARCFELHLNLLRHGQMLPQ